MQYKLTKSESIIISLNQTSTMSALMKWIFSAFFFVTLGFAGGGYLAYKVFSTKTPEKVILTIKLNLTNLLANEGSRNKNKNKKTKRFKFNLF